MRRRKRLGLVISLLAFTCLAVGIGYAAIPNGGVISGCYMKSGGALRVIDATVTNCKTGETRLDWNMQGVKGDQGIQGVKGDQGIQGIQGVKGDQGIQGIQGIQGVKGDKGDDGAPGTPGASTATFITLAQPVGINGLVDPSPQLIVSKQLPPGSWAVVATVNTTMHEKAGGGDVTSDLTCQLRSGANVIGSATDRRFSPGGDFSRRTLSMNGGAFVQAGTGPVSIWCGTNFAETIETAQIMMIQVGGFS